MNQFSELYGSTPDSKDEVMQGVKWTLNGQRNPKYAPSASPVASRFTNTSLLFRYAYNGVGDPSS